MTEGLHSTAKPVPLQLLLTELTPCLCVLSTIWRIKVSKELCLAHAAITDQLLQATAVKAAGWWGVFVWEQRFVNS